MSVHSRIELVFGNTGFEERGKSEYPEKNLSEHSRKPTTKFRKFTHMTSGPGIEHGTHGGRRALSPLRHPCSVNKPIFSVAFKPISGVRFSLTIKNLTLYFALFRGFTTGRAHVPIGLTLVPFHVPRDWEQGARSKFSTCLYGKILAPAPQ